jgi:hypothetical protein
MVCKLASSSVLSATMSVPAKTPGNETAAEQEFLFNPDRAAVDEEQTAYGVAVSPRGERTACPPALSAPGCEPRLGRAGLGVAGAGKVRTSTLTLSPGVTDATPTVIFQT